MYYLCISEEERAHKQAGILRFCWSKTGCFTSEIEKNTSEIFLFLGGINFFLGVIRKNLRQVVAIIADVEPRKVKRYLFSQGAFLTFRGSIQVDF